MSTIYIYQNKRNNHKFIEVHNDGHYHNSVRQYIKTENLHEPQYTGDGYLHRWRKENLRELLDDYVFVNKIQRDSIFYKSSLKAAQSHR